MADYILYIVLRAVVFLMRFLPLEAWLFLARRAGWVYYYFAGKKNKRAYANLKTAFGHRSGRELKQIIKRLYQRLAQNAVETLYLPYVNDNFIRRHIFLPQRNMVEEALKGKGGIIFLGSHAGSWELSNIACAMLFSAEGARTGDKEGSRYAMLAQPQSRTKRVDAFLNALRESKGCHVIRIGELKKMVEYLSGNNMLGVVADHGGKDGIPVEFFGKLAMTPIGSVRLAKKLGSKIILAFMHRLEGADHELLFKSYDLITTDNPTEDLKTNLSSINKIFQHWITQYPEEYLWFYKRWKHSPQRNILVLSDGKAGHLKQSLALLEMIKDLGFEVKSDVVELTYKRGGLKVLLLLTGLFFGQRLLRACLGRILTKDCYNRLMRGSYDVVISAGASLAAVNLALAFENNARAISIMKPGMFSLSRFDLVILPEHDRPPQKKNIVVTLGSLNSVDASSMKNDFMHLCSVRHALEGVVAEKKLKVGLLIGGNSKNYELLPEMIVGLCQQLKGVLEERDGTLFLTTSRRTPENILIILKKYFKDYPRCKLFVDAREDNPAGTVGGIFYLSDAVIVSGESISMVSEAAASGRHVLVFEPCPRRDDNKVSRFLNSLVSKNYIHLVKINEIAGELRGLMASPPVQKRLDAKSAVTQGLKEVL
jgi:KDO2-lipid IV(A) lauroyltransferase